MNHPSFNFGLLLSVVVVCLSCCPTRSSAIETLAATEKKSETENWPGWRGPRGDGTSLETDVPLKWSSADNIRWKVPITGTGHSSPVVWKDKVFVTSCLEDSHERVLICLNATSGKELWQKTVVEAPLEKKHNLNSFASGTPATDGESVFVSFLKVGDSEVPAKNVSRPRPIKDGDMIVAAYDLEGNERWKMSPGPFASVHGFCTSPLLYKDMVILNGDHDGDSYIVALKKNSGDEVWRVSRKHKTRSYVTPIIRDFDGRTQMILSGSKRVTSYDPDTGDLHWEIDGPTEQFVASLVDNGEWIFLTAGFPEHHILAIDPTGKGNVTNTHIRWRTTKNCSYVPSPVIAGNYFLVASDDGVASCYDAKSGERLWFERLGNHYSGSLVTANGLVYFIEDSGITKVVRPGPKFELVAENDLGEFVFSSPAISNSRIFIRGEKHLYCIGK